MRKRRGVMWRWHQLPVLADKTIKGVNKMKIVLTLKTYLVPNVDNPIVRIPIWKETQTFETHIIGDFTIEKTLTVYVAYKEDNGNIVPEVKFVE